MTLTTTQQRQLESASAGPGAPTLKAAEVLAGKHRAVFRRTYCEVRCVPIAEAAEGVPCDATSDASKRGASLRANTSLPSYAMRFNTIPTAPALSLALSFYLVRHQLVRHQTQRIPPTLMPIRHSQRVVCLPV